MADDSAANSTVTRFVTTLVINVVIGSIIFLIWIILRTFLQYVYHPRQGENIPRFSRIPFKWLWDCLKLRDKTLFLTHGPDVVFYFRTIRFMLVAVWFMVVPMIVLFPLHATGSNKDLPDGDPKKMRGIEVITMGNIPDGDDAFAAHVVFVWWISIVLYLGIWWTYRQYVIDRARYWFGRRDARCHTLLVRGIPTNMDEAALQNLFENMFNCKVLAVHLVRKCPGLKKKRKEHLKFSNKLEKAEWQIARLKEGKQRPTTRTKFFGLIGKKVDAEEFFQEQKALFAEKIKGRHADPDHYKRTSAALVTMNQTFPTRCEFHLNMPSWERSGVQMTALPAPEPEDILWDSLKIGKISHFVRVCLVWAFLVALIFFWTIPVTFIASIANLGTISQIEGFSWVSGIADVEPVIRGFIEGFLPSLVLIIFMALLIPIIKLVTWLEGLISYSEWQRKVYNRYFYFQLVNVMLVSTFAGGVFNIIQKIIDSPTDAPELLAQTLPQQALYFITYVLIATFINLSLYLLRIVAVILWIIKRILAKTDREIQAVNSPSPNDIGPTLAMRMLVFGLILLYHLMNPLMIPCGILYLTFSYISDRYNMLFVFKNNWDAGGAIWQSAYHNFMVLILIFQAAMIGLLSINKFLGVFALIPLPIITCLLWYSLFRMYCHQGQWGSLEDGWSKKRDEEEQEEEGRLIDYDSFASVYIQPPFQPLEEEEEHEEDEEDNEKAEKGEGGKDVEMTPLKKDNNSTKEDSDTSSSSDYETDEEKDKAV